MEGHRRRDRLYYALAAALTLLVAAGLRLAALPDLPVGLHYDEAANGILAAEIARGVKHPVFISAYTGKEVLFFYWAAAWMRVLGAGPVALRLTSAVVGICTVAATAWVGYELFPHRRGRAWIGLIGAAFVATSFWHLVLSRYGFRAVTQPLLQALTVAALWRGLRRHSRGWIGLGGLLCGATLYTYLAARAFPIPVGAALLTLLLVDRGQRRRRLGDLLVFAAGTAVAIAPLAAYFAAHPAALTTRVEQVAARSWAEAWEGFVACLRMFFLRGDPYIRFNLPHRPLLDPVTAALALAGLALLVVQRGQRTHRPLAAASRVLLSLLLPVMLLPSALATGEITPSNLRVVGLLPFLYLLPALPLASLAAATRQRLRGRTLLVTVLLVLMVLSPITAYRYFRQWAPSRELYEAADGDLADAARFLNRRDLTGTIPYVASIHYRHPTVAFLAERYPEVRWLTGGQTLVFPAEGQGLLILPRSADGGLAWIEERLGSGTALPSPLGPDGRPAFRAYRVEPSAAPTPSHPARANFGNAATLVGYDLLETPRSGATVEVVLYWRVEARPQPGDLLVVASLTDPWGGVWGQARPFHYPAEQWTPGELVLDHLSVPVAAGAPPGPYRLRVGFYAASDGTTLPVLDDGGFAGTGVDLPLTLERAAAPPTPEDLPIRQRLDLPTEVGVRLLGADLATSHLRPGERVYLTLFWQAEVTPTTELTVELALGDRPLYRGAPVHGTFPFTTWTPGEVVADRYDPRLDRHAPPGTYPIRLTLTDPEGNTVLGPVSLGEVTVETLERTFEAPSPQHPVGATLGDRVELLGYDVTPPEPTPGTQVQITLYWRALTEMETRYTVFIHLLDANGGVVAQHDGMPVGGTYPTDLWVAGEVIDDLHVLEIPAALPPGAYTLEAGLYVAETGERLTGANAPGGALRLAPLVVGPVGE